MRGGGRLTLASIFESPAALALASPMLMLATVAVFPAPVLWQLTMTRGPAEVAWPVTRLGPGGG